MLSSVCSFGSFGLFHEFSVMTLLPSDTMDRPLMSRGINRVEAVLLAGLVVFDCELVAFFALTSACSSF